MERRREQGAASSPGRAALWSRGCRLEIFKSGNWQLALFVCLWFLGRRLQRGANFFSLFFTIRQWGEVVR